MQTGVRSKPGKTDLDLKYGRLLNRIAVCGYLEPRGTVVRSPKSHGKICGRLVGYGLTTATVDTGYLTYLIRKHSSFPSFYILSKRCRHQIFKRLLNNLMGNHEGLADYPTSP